MRLPHHIAASTAVSGIIYGTTGSPALAAASFIAGIFIDLDHIFDVIREHGRAVTVRDFFRICNTAQFERIFLVWHGWEWLVAGTAIAWYFSWNHWIVGALIGFTHHMILDTIHNSTNLRTYSLLYRWKNDFHFDTVFTKMTEQKYTFK